VGWDIPVSWTLVAILAATAYAISVAIYLILENRSPQSTFAWLFLLLVFPVGGLAIYHLFGRSWHAFSRTKELKKLLDGSALSTKLALVEAQSSLDARSLHEFEGLSRMLWSSARAPITHATRFDVLQDAREKYPRLLDDIRAASRYVHMAYYEWASDPFTEWVEMALAAKAAEGVAVRILYDPVGSLQMLSRRYVRRIRAAGIQMLPFSPLYQLHTISYRNHRKIAIVDGTIGYSGGLNMTEKHLTGPDGFDGWRDTHARVEGETALALQGVFATMWNNMTGENLLTEEYLPDASGAKGRVPVQVVNAGPDSRWKAIRQSYLAMIALARDHVYIQSPFLIPDDSLSEAMKAKALSGVKVWVMIAPRGGEGQLAYRAGMTYACDLAGAGVNVLLYQGAYFHAKTVCVDSQICSIGSANMDIRSFTINYETNLVVYDRDVTRKLEHDFERDMQSCAAFSASEYEKLRMTTRLADSTMRLCSPLL
jgi:cardiolipin synthase